MPFSPTSLLRVMPLVALMFTGGCAYDSYALGYNTGYAPEYPPGYDDGMGSGQMIQPGDLFGGQNVQSIDAFFEPLAQYGQWVDSRFGRAFLPNASPGWRPYVNGRWGEDRLWISDDPWGWATDHYGRWGYDERINAWVWVPGTEWAPSWVAWREADQADGQVVGWAPIPPGVNYSFGVGFGSGFGFDNFNSWYGPSWVWVPSAYLYQPRFGGRVLPWNRGFDYWRGSRWNWNSGWNGRPGYGNWQGRAGGWNGGRPGGNWNGGRPGGNWNGNRPRQPAVGGAIGGSIAGVPQRPGYSGNWQGRPNGGNWQGRPNGGNWQGRPNGGNQAGRPGYNQGRPPGVGEAIGGGISGAPVRPPANWQGRPGNGQPGTGANFGRPRPDGVPGGVPGGGRPAYQGGNVGGAIAGGMVQRPVPQVQRSAPPQVQRSAPPQVQRSAPPPRGDNGGGFRGRSGESRAERPQ
ncbi:DUF6600 domain-containing protein [Sandarakinorhabdus sp. DWP1-3-1]|uniref:DUF6600 domain-containing protein n=1 Tax=Sandarakinorhabdus sp. DWP1-3-1 TaxID=2804627 RepID=UPI003CE9470F